jgi:hypothetical protein
VGWRTRLPLSSVSWLWFSWAGPSRRWTQPASHSCSRRPTRYDALSQDGSEVAGSMAGGGCRRSSDDGKRGQLAQPGVRRREGLREDVGHCERDGASQNPTSLVALQSATDQGASTYVPASRWVLVYAQRGMRTKSALARKEGSAQRESRVTAH